MGVTVEVEIDPAAIAACLAGKSEDDAATWLSGFCHALGADDRRLLRRALLQVAMPHYVDPEDDEQCDGLGGRA